MNARTFALLLATWLAFGSVFVVIKIGVGVMPPLVLGAIRFLFAGAILYAITIRLPHTDPDPIGPRQLVASAAIGCAMAAVNGMVMIASTQMDSWIVSVLTCTIPLWSYAASLLVLHRPVQAAEVFGVFCGIGGIVVLLWPSTHEAVHVALPVAVVLLATAVLWGVATVVENRPRYPRVRSWRWACKWCFAGSRWPSGRLGSAKSVDSPRQPFSPRPRSAQSPFS